MFTARTTAAAQTQEIAAAISPLCEPGDLFVLAGDLGAGKTAFVQGFGRALGVTEPITSPTFTLANEYAGRLTVHHLDVYRIEQLDEVRDLALSELLDGPAVTLIEWGDTIMSALPNDFLEILFTFGDGDDDRELSIRCIGPRWSGRSGLLQSALDGWLVDPC